MRMVPVCLLPRGCAQASPSPSPMRIRQSPWDPATCPFWPPHVWWPCWRRPRSWPWSDTSRPAIPRWACAFTSTTWPPPEQVERCSPRRFSNRSTKGASPSRPQPRVKARRSRPPRSRGSWLRPHRSWNRSTDAHRSQARRHTERRTRQVPLTRPPPDT